MHDPRMVIVAGPSGGGKSSLFPISDLEGVTPFSTDDYCAELNGQRLGRPGRVYRGIPPDIRAMGGEALKRFIDGNIAARRSFSFETTLREITFEQARRAKANGFRVEMFFVAAGPPEEHIRRVTLRAHAGGHSASEGALREIYDRGMRLLVTAFEENRNGNIELLAVFHNPRVAYQKVFESIPIPATLIVEMVHGQPDLEKGIMSNAPPWFEAAVRGTMFELKKLRARVRDDFVV
jgi:predicted ABC-type ATPase